MSDHPRSSPADSAPPHSGDTAQGFIFATSAYLLWGMLPFYMKAMVHVPATEIVAHRIIWSVPIAAGILFAIGRTDDIKAALKSPKTLAQATLTASIIALNWGIYVWAIAEEKALEAALGYYINPLFSIFLGFALLGERLSRTQWIAIALASLAVGVITWRAGGLPWASVGLAVSFGFYALCKKTLPIGPTQGFTLEILLLFPFAAGYVIWLEERATGHFLEAGIENTFLLMGAGAVTAIPLILYASGAKLMRLSTIGILQYIAPTMIFLAAVFAFGEPFDAVRLFAFVLIWSAVILYSWSLLAERRAKRV